MSVWRHAMTFLLPSVVAAALGAAATGFLDGIRNTYSLLQACAAAGYYSIIAVPIGIALAIAVRLHWRRWTVNETLEASQDPVTGGHPHVAGWLVWGLLATWLLSLLSINILRTLLAQTGAREVVALVGTMATVGIAVALVLASRGQAYWLGLGIQWVDRVFHRRAGFSITTRWWLVGWTSFWLVVFLGLSWFVSVKPRIGYLDITFLYYIALNLAILFAVHMAWRLVRDSRRRCVIASAIPLTLVAAFIATAVWVRYERPYSMLEVWGNAEVAGTTTDWIYDVQSLRGELRLEEFAPVEKPGAPHHDIVFITIDTMRADRTSPYHGPARTKTLAMVSREGARFAWAFSPGNVTRRSLPTIATGLSPRRIRGRVAGWALRMDPRHIMVAERFRAAGYDTAGFFCCGSHFARRHRLGLVRGVDHVEIHHKGPILTELALRWLEKREASGTKKPLFLWIHYVEPHDWDKNYPHKTHGGPKQRRYDMSLVDTDALMGKIVDAVWSKEQRDHTYLIITSDHGEGLGDHQARHHSSDVYNSQIRVPLVIAGPGIKANKTIRRAVGLVSIAPTLLDLAGYEPPGMPYMDGKSLGPLLRSGDPSTMQGGEAYSVMIRDRSVEYDMAAVVLDQYKLIDKGDGTFELYDISRDRNELKNLARDESKSEVLERLKAKLAEYRKLDSIAPF